MAKYRVETDNGIFEVEVDEGIQTPSAQNTPLESKPSGLLEASRGALSSLASVPGKVAKFATDPEAQARSLPLLGGIAGTAVSPVAGSALGAAGGTALRDIALAALGTSDAPKTAQETLTNQAIAGGSTALLGGAGKAIGAGLKFGKQALAPTTEQATAKLLPILEKEGLKDVKPIIFNKGEREAAVNYAENAAKSAAEGKLTPAQLQEARSTLKDVLDNRIVTASSPTGQTISRAKEVVTKELSRQKPEVGKGLRDVGKAFEAVPTKRFLKKIGAETRRGAIQAALTAAGIGAIGKLF